MTKLIASSATIEIIPYERETPVSNWINTQITLDYHIQEQYIKFQFPSENIFVRVEDYRNLIEGVRSHLDTLPIQPITSVNRQWKNFHFMPMEPSFELRLGSGAYSDEERQDGFIYIDFKIGLRVLNVKELVGDQIGCVVEVKITELMNFVIELEREVNALILNE